MKISTILVMLVLSACSAIGATRPEAGVEKSLDLGIIPIGATSIDLGSFESTDCSDKGRGMDDCSATDSDGRHYAFFSGALSMVSAGSARAPRVLILPAGMQFGDNIDEAARKAADAYDTKFDVGDVDGVIAYSSPMDIRSSSGVLYSMELISDKDGRLVKVVQRTDF